MYIDKFQRVVEIAEDHPLAVAQRAKNAESEHTADDPSGSTRERAAAPVAPQPASSPRKRGRR